MTIVGASSENQHHLQKAEGAEDQDAKNADHLALPAATGSGRIIATSESAFKLIS